MSEAITLLVGGRSTEHDTSIHSYGNVLEELLADGTKLTIAGVTYVDLDNHAHFHRAPPWPRDEAALAAPPMVPLLQAVAELARSKSFVFSLMHGNEGEDGAWQGLAEIADLEGNFGPILPAALAMSKFAMASLATSATTLRTPRTLLLDRHASEADLRHAVDELGTRPVVLKPNRMGSSLLAESYRSLDLATLERVRDRLLPYDSELLIQEYVAGQEYTAGCLEIGGEIRVLPPLAVTTAGRFLGHAEKHEPGRVRAKVADDDAAAERIRKASEELFRALDFLGLCRFDYILGDDDVLYFLEANTLPGLSHGSAFPRMLRAAGLTMTDLVAACVTAARARPKRRKTLRYRIAT